MDSCFIKNIKGIQLTFHNHPENEEKVCNLLSAFGLELQEENSNVKNWSSLTLYGWKNTDLFSILNKLGTKSVTIEEYKKLIQI